MKKFWKYSPSPKSIFCGIVIGVIIGTAISTSASDKNVPSAPKEVKLEHVYHLACEFEAESYEPSEVVGGVKFPMLCGCSEIKGTCGNEVIKYTLPDSYFKDEE